MTGNCHARCGVGENPAIASKDYLSLLPQIPDFEKVIAFVRSMGMSLNVIVQNLAQLKAKYEKTWEVITGNCDSLLFLGGKEESTLKYLSEALGKETIDVRGHNKTKGKQPSTSENNSIMGRELMQQNEIASMPITDCLLLIRSHNPFYCMKFPIEKHPNYIYLADYDENNAFDVHTIHSITVVEFMQSQKIATNGNIETKKDQIAAAFTREPVEITFETYADAALYGETDMPDIAEEYADDSPKYGTVSDLESFDLGEPIREPRKEVTPDEDGERTLKSKEFKEFCRYSVPDENVQHIEDLNAAEVSGAVVRTEDRYYESIPDDYLQDEDLEGMENWDGYMT